MGTGLTSVPQPGTTCPSLVCCSTPQGRPSWGTGLEVWSLGGNRPPALHGPTSLGTAKQGGQRQPLPWLTPPPSCWEAELMQVTQAGPKGRRGMVRRACGGTGLHPTQERSGQGASPALTSLCSASLRQGPDWEPSVQNLFSGLLSPHLKSEMPPLAIHSFRRLRGTVHAHTHTHTHTHTQNNSGFAVRQARM